MCTGRKSLYCILPPHILRALLQQEEDRRLRDAALKTLTISIRLHERRAILGRMAVGPPPAESDAQSITDKADPIYLEP
jgi:hypothetical protein